MLTLAVAHRAETYERIQAPLEDRGIATEHVSISGGTTHLLDPSLDTAGIDAGFVFPGRLMEGGVLAALLGVPWVNDREAVLSSRNKAETLARLAAADLPVPETVLVSHPANGPDIEAAAEQLGPPLVVKPNSTTRGTGVLKVADLDSLHGATDYLDLIHEFPGTGDRSYLLQEYLPEARDFRIMVIDGEFVGAVERSIPASARDAGRWKHNVHRGAEATPVLPAKSVRDLAEEAAQVMDIPVVGVDILSTGERTVITETNARPTIDDAGKYIEGFYDKLAGVIRESAESQ